MYIYYTKLSEGEIRTRELERAGQLTPEQIEERKLERNAFKLKRCMRCSYEDITPDMAVCPRCSLALNEKIAEAELKKEKEMQAKIDDITTIKNEQEAMMTKLENALKLIDMYKKSGKK